MAVWDTGRDHTSSTPMGGQEGAALLLQVTQVWRVKPLAQPGSLWADPPCLARGSQDTVPTRPTAPAITSHSGVKLERQGSGLQPPGSKHPTDKAVA